MRGSVGGSAVEAILGSWTDLFIPPKRAGAFIELERRELRFRGVLHLSCSWTGVSNEIQGPEHMASKLTEFGEGNQAVLMITDIWY